MFLFQTNNTLFEGVRYENNTVIYTPLSAQGIGGAMMLGTFFGDGASVPSAGAVTLSTSVIVYATGTTVYGGGFNGANGTALVVRNKQAPRPNTGDAAATLRGAPNRRRPLRAAAPRPAIRPWSGTGGTWADHRISENSARGCLDLDPCSRLRRSATADKRNFAVCSPLLLRSAAKSSIDSPCSAGRDQGGRSQWQDEGVRLCWSLCSRPAQWDA